MDRQQMGLRGAVASMDEDILIRKDYFREDWPTRKWFIKDLRNVLREEDGREVTFNQAGRMVTITYTHQGKRGAKTACSYASNGLLSSYVGEGYKVEARYKDNNADINVFAETKNYKTPNLAKADLNQTPYSNSYPFDLKCRQQLTDDGLVMKSSYFYLDSMPAMVYDYNYNHINQLVSEKCSDFTSGEKVQSYTKYTYDNQGYLIRKTIHSKAIDETWNYENNEFGDCTKLTIERPYGTIVYTFEYQYDEFDNWTVRLQFEDGVFDNAALRTLTYHRGAEKAVKNANDNAATGDEAYAKQAEKEARAAAKEADRQAKAQAREEAKAERDRIREEEKNMSKEERKAAQEQRKAVAAAQKEKEAAERRALKEQERLAREQEMAAKRAEKEAERAEKQAAKEKAAAEK